MQQAILPGRNPEDGQRPRQDCHSTETRDIHALSHAIELVSSCEAGKTWHTGAVGHLRLPSRAITSLGKNLIGTLTVSGPNSLTRFGRSINGKPGTVCGGPKTLKGLAVNVPTKSSGHQRQIALAATVRIATQVQKSSA